MKAVIFALISLFYLSASEQIASQRRRHISSVYNNGTTLGYSTNGLLERVYDRVTALTTLDEQQLKRLEALEYKMTRLEVTNQERLDNLREELKEISRRNQNIDWLISKSDGTLDQLRNDIEAMRHGLDTTGFRSQPTAVQQPSDDLECSEKLAALATLLTSTRAAVHSIETALSSIGQNLTHLVVSTREAHQRQHSFPTKQYLNSALHSIRSQPVYALMHSGLPNQLPGTSTIPTSCSSSSIAESGVYKIQVTSVTGPFFVMCDTETEGGGWTLIQQRKDGSVNFYRHWLEYKLGFGNIANEFFIGLDKLHEITTTTLHELLITLEDFEGDKKYAKYDMFAIGGEKEDYALNLLGKYEGTAGDSLSYSASHKFSTFDNDNDGWVEGNCAQAHTGAWWYNACEMSNLNGQYLGGEITDTHQFQGIYWDEFHGPKYSLKSVKMFIRPVERIDKIFGSDLN